MTISVYIACSLDGFIADKEGEIGWLDHVAGTEKLDIGYSSFMSGIDALVMGRKIFDTVCNF